jgi:hypothetical protein
LKEVSVPGHDFLATIPLAYVGPGIGLEFIPYLIGLMAWAGLALGAIFFRPFFSLLRLFKTSKEDLNGSATPEFASELATPPGSHDQTAEIRCRNDGGKN